MFVLRPTLTLGIFSFCFILFHLLLYVCTGLFKFLTFNSTMLSPSCWYDNYGDPINVRK